MALYTATVDVWQHHARTAHTTTVVPDGCCDLIWHALPGQAPQWFVTDLADQRYDVPGTVDERYWGYRMQAGTSIDRTRLLAAVAARPGCDADYILPLLHDCTRLDAPVHDALLALADSPSVAHAARALGVAERTLQRVVSTGTGRPPTYWKRLARLRRAARAIAQVPAHTPLQAATLADTAADWGYVDQAHMTHEFRRWLGTTPAALREQPDLHVALAATGYG